MLLLTRNPGKSIIIGGNIRVLVAGVSGQQVRLGIVAPAGVVVDREEIHERRTAQGEALRAGRTEGEWRELLAEEAAEQVEWDKARKLLNPEAFSIDEHIKLMADARRYRWLRDEALTTDSGFTPAVYDRAGGIGHVRTGEELDQRIDSAIRNFTQQQVAQERQQ